MSSGWVALVMLALFVLVAGAFAWQERARLPQRGLVYGTDDAVAFVTARLSAETAAALDEHDVRRILEWEMDFLHKQMAEGDFVVVAGLEAARHAQERLHEQGHSYDGRLIVEVMELQAQYLAAIGAVAEAAAAEEVSEVFDDPDAPGPARDDSARDD